MAAAIAPDTVAAAETAPYVVNVICRSPSSSGTTGAICAS
jgi:hypothetical protein